MNYRPATNQGKADWRARAEKAEAQVKDHAADRAALVAQLEAAQTRAESRLDLIGQLRSNNEAAESQVAELTRERDELRVAFGRAARWSKETRLVEVESQVAELIQERNEALEQVKVRDDIIARLRNDLEFAESKIPKLCSECCYTHRADEPHGRRRDVD